MRIAALLLCVSAHAETIAITGATVVDGTGAPARKATVVVTGGRIASIGAQAPPNARVIDASGHTLTPGFFDLHTHLPYSAVSGIKGDWPKVLAAYLASGVTTATDFGTYPETFEPMRRLLRERVVEGPRIHFAARITTPGGHGAEGGRGDFFSLEVQTVAEARAAARRWLAYEPDAIKVFTDGWRYGADTDMTSMEEPVLAAIVKDAHAKGVEVLTHTVTLDKAKVAARAGVDVIAHGIGDTRADSDLIALMRKNGTAYAPTLAVYEHKGLRVDSLARTLLEPAALKLLDARKSAAPQSKARARRWENLMANVKLLRAGSIPIATGTDAGVTGAYHGYSTLREMELLVAGGLTPLEALTAATGVAARAIKVDHERGTIEPGKLADLVLIQGAPHEEIGAVRNVARVFQGGREVDRGKLLRMIASPDVSPMPARKASAVIDDMERRDGRTSLDTLRVNATDSSVAHTKMLFSTIARARGNQALSIQASMAEKSRPYAQVWFPLSRGGVEPVDASAFQGVRFEARGEGSYNVSLQTRKSRGYTEPSAAFDAGAEWREVEIPFRAFKPGPALDALQVIEFEIARPAGSHGWLELDNLRFY